MADETDVNISIIGAMAPDIVQVEAPVNVGGDGDGDGDGNGDSDVFGDSSDDEAALGASNAIKESPEEDDDDDEFAAALDIEMIGATPHDLVIEHIESERTEDEAGSPDEKKLLKYDDITNDDGVEEAVQEEEITVEIVAQPESCQSELIRGDDESSELSIATMQESSSVLKAHGSALDSAVDNVSEDAEGEAHKEGQLDIQKELEEWDRVSAFREKLAEEEEERLKVSKAGIKPKDAQTPIGWKEALAFFKAQDVSVQKNEIHVYDFRKVGFFRRWARKCFGPPTLNAPLSEERDLVFCIARIQLDIGVEEHFRILQTVYKRLTGDMATVPATGSHWEVLGFQGNNPATDLRGSGMLGLIQILHFIQEDKSLLLKIFQLSRDDRQNFPFAVVSFNFTGICINTLREANVYPMIRTKNSVFDVMGLLHRSLFYNMYLKWKNEGKAIAEFPFVRGSLEKMAHNNAANLIQIYVDNCSTAIDKEAAQNEEFVPH